MKFAVGNAQHIGERPEQQDAFGFSDPKQKTFVSHGGLLGVVADGMGGLAHGSAASTTAVRVFREKYEAKSGGESIDEALMRSLFEANRAVCSLAEKASQPDGVGTTLVAAVLSNGSLHWISVGDSRIYVLRGKHFVQVTTDHIYANVLRKEAALGAISLEEAQSHSERESLTSYLGLADLREIDRSLKPFPLESGDRVVLCTDGLYRALLPEEIVGTFQSDLERACESSVQQAIKKCRAHQDNLTILALELETETGHPRLKTLLVWMLAGFVSGPAVAGASYWYEKHREAKGAPAVITNQKSNEADQGSLPKGGNSTAPESKEGTESKKDKPQEVEGETSAGTKKPHSKKKKGIRNEARDAATGDAKKGGPASNAESPEKKATSPPSQPTGPDKDKSLPNPPPDPNSAPDATQPKSALPFESDKSL